MTQSGGKCRWTPIEIWLFLLWRRERKVFPLRRSVLKPKNARLFTTTIFPSELSFENHCSGCTACRADILRPLSWLYIFLDAVRSADCCTFIPQRSVNFMQNKFVWNAKCGSLEVRILPGHFSEGNVNVKASFGRCFHKVNLVLPTKSFAIFAIHNAVLAVTFIPCQKRILL